MTFKQWEMIGRRYIWYRGVLAARMREWPERIRASTNLAELQAVIRVAEHVERLEERIQRHADRGLALVGYPNSARN